LLPADRAGVGGDRRQPVDISAAPFYRYMRKVDTRIYRLRRS
jgi:hypothetical protein